jgi:tripartite-type tricarboxylate transporter receptor subunit TctC
VSAKSPFKSLGEFIKAAKDQPGKLNLGTIVVGSTQHLGAELFKSTAGIDVQLVTFRRTPEVIVGLERNDIQMMIDFYAPMRGALDAKKVRAVAVSGSERIEAIPDVPTAEQAGVKNYVVTSWNGLFAPAGTPKPIVDALNAALVEILALPDVKKRYAELGITARASTPAVLRDRLVGDIQKWGAVIEKAKIPKR